ncbi:MAG: cupin domain-containing protein [Gammaproteobacteria bacterium]|nr:cupin domain-containing protein [Gammaproteobacteria bacterium]
MNPKKQDSKDALMGDFVKYLAEALHTDPPTSEQRKSIFNRILQNIRLASGNPLPDYHTVHQDTGVWMEVAEGVEMKILYKDARSTSFFLKLKPGARLHSHIHIADEECLVLDGELMLGEGIHLQKGDYHFAAKGLPHAVAYSRTGALLFLRSEKPAYQI